MILKLVLLVVLMAQQGPFRPRWGFITPLPETPTISILLPTTQPTISVSTTPLDISGVSSDDDGVTAVNYTRTSGACSAASGTATGTSSWSFSISFPGAGVCTYSVTATDGTFTSIPAIITITYIDESGGNDVEPDVEITTNLGADFGVTTIPQTLVGTATDNVGVTSMTCLNTTTSQTCSVDMSGSPLSRNWTASAISLQSGANVIRISATDQATNTGFDEITITYTPPLAVTTTALPQCRELTAYAGNDALQATGGTPPYTWTKLSGTFPAGTPAFAVTSDGGSPYHGNITGTPDNGVAGTFPNLIFRVTDNVAATADTAALSMICVDDAAEQRHDYFEYQVDTNDGTAGGSGRITCVNQSSSDCIMPVTKCLDATYFDNGACRLAGDLTDPIAMTEALARTQIESITNDSTLSATMGTLRAPTVGYSADTYANKQIGAKIILPGDSTGAEDGYCDEAAGTVDLGCSDLGSDNNLKTALGFDIDIGTGTGNFAIVVDNWYGPEWLPNGDWSGGSGQAVVANCTGGVSALGSRNARKAFRINAIGDPIYLAWKVDSRHAGADGYFVTGGGDTTGYWDCDDNIVGTAFASAQTSTTKTSGQSLVSPRTVGVYDSDSGFVASGKGTFFLNQGEDFPIIHSRWTRWIFFVKWGVPANSSYFNDFRDDCDQRDRTSTLGSYVPGAANDRSAIAGTDDAQCAGMLTNLDPTTGLSIAGQDAGCDSVDEAGCDSLWVAISAWICDELRPCQRIAYRIPWWTQKPGTSTNLLIHDFWVEYDSSTPACNHCGDAIIYQGPWFMLLNIDEDDVDDSDCPTVGGTGTCAGDVAPLNKNLLKMPVR